MLKRLNVQNKILATLAVPILVIVAAAAVFSGLTISAWREAQQTRDVVVLVDTGQSLIKVIQNERYWAIETRRGSAGAQEEWEAAIEARNSALDTVGAALSEVNTSSLSDDVTAAIASSLRNTRVYLDSAAEQVRRGAATTQVTSQAYTEAVDGILRISEELANTATDRRVGNAAQAYVDVARYSDSTIAEIPLISEALAIARETDTTVRVYRELGLTIRVTNSERETARATLSRLNNVNINNIGIASAQYTAIRQYLANANASAISGPLAEQWGDLAQAEVDQIDPIVVETTTELKNSADDSLTTAQTEAILTLVLVVVVFGASLAIAYVTSRSITRPLKRLTESAERVKDELPTLVEQVAIPGQGPELEFEAIDIDSRDEVGQLAAAFNSVNSTTIEVAREQAALRGSIAEMFVNVARRDHILLNRQLGFLDELERAEEDPNILANLFRLDHLATRMRRNSESLLVLAGIDSGRRVRQPMPMSDVVRTASSEIELYDRIQLNLQSDPAMLGHNALNAAHLIAELLENATNFSEPNTPVEVTTDAGRNFVTVTIRDYGLGMSDQDIQDANARVASKSATDVIGVQRVGLFVVGRLADRLGVHVAFSRPADGSNGTIATLSFPWTLFTDAAFQEYQGQPGQGAAQPMPQPGAQPSSQFATQTQGYPVEEPPVVSAVDLNALTDGQTGTGMPRRKVQGAEPTGPQPVQSHQGFAPRQDYSGAPQAPAQQAPMQQQQPAPQQPQQQPGQLPARGGGGLPSRGGSAPMQPAPAGSGLPSRGGTSGGQGVGISPDFGDNSPEIVLPPLATPTRSVNFGDDAGAPWQPQTIQEAKPLVTRRPARQEEIVEEPLGPDAALAHQPERRSAMFSNFRSFTAAQENNGGAQAPSAGSPFAVARDDDDATQVIDRVQDDAEPRDVAESWQAQESREQSAPSAPAQWGGGQQQAGENLNTGRVDLSKFAHLPTRASRARAASDPQPGAPASAHSVAADAPVPQEPSGYAPNPDMIIPGLVEEAREAVQQTHQQQTPAQYYRSAASAYSAPSAHEAYDAHEDGNYGQSLPPQKPESVYQASQQGSYQQHTHGGGQSYSDQQNQEQAAAPWQAQGPSGHEPIARPQFAPVFGAGAPVQEAAVPHFADVVSDAPADDAKDKKNGIRGWLRKGKSTPTSEHPTVTRNENFSDPQFGGQQQFTTPGNGYDPAGGQAQHTPSQPQQARDGYAPFGQPAAPAHNVPQVPQRVSSFGAASAPHAASAQAAPSQFNAGQTQAWEPSFAPNVQESAAQEFPQGGVGVTQWQPPTDLTVDVNSAFALKSTIQEQALAELSQLSAYRPSEVNTREAESLVRRVRSNASPQALTDDPTTQKISRDASELRARLSAFQSATSRGRRDGASGARTQTSQGDDRNGQSQRVPDSASHF
ncbi:HAMP domain-containing sensor histidine kinase [Jonesia quinghaiensis]|uniref:HAMP domain-containing sensor histidine kinase n=1 Tax=Jonesia quinghaiensis TaxID=262806 RepID=UPI00040633FD|nr:ATP-binding protein [Jonesia quinghaiensis]